MLRPTQQNAAVFLLAFPISAFSYLHPDSHPQAVAALVVSHMCYCLVVSRNASSKNIDDIKRKNTPPERLLEKATQASFF